MAKMIPAFIGKETISNGERKVFELLKKLDDRYTVIHSVGLASHKSKVYGEVDFVVICTEGILCLEVKGGRVYRDNGIWRFVNKDGKVNAKTEGPFEQVQGAMHSLRGYFKTKFGEYDPLTRCQYACGVVFPDIEFKQQGPDIISQVVFDNRNTDGELPDYIKSIFGYWRDQMRSKHGFEGGKLSPEQISKAVSVIRGDFGFVPSLDFILRSTEEQIVQLTQEQMGVLNMIEESPRTIIRGAAGTGKTLLALEYAKRKSAQAKSVLYLCFNRMLPLFIRRSLEKQKVENGLIKVDSFHGLLLNKIGEYGIPIQGEGNEFYTRVVPEKFYELAETCGLSVKYDVVIIDEGQDLLTEEYLLCIDKFINGGLAEGEWQLYYDPNQNIFKKDIDTKISFLKKYGAFPIKIEKNCRNTKPIGIYTTLYTGVLPARSFRVDGENVISESYKDSLEQRRKLHGLVSRLLGQGVKPGSITILSPAKYENSCLKGENIFGSRCSFQNITGLPPDFIRDDCVKFCTVQSFKGLESTVVIYIDVENFSSNDSRLLNYTAMTRAKSLLCILYKDSSSDEMNDIIKESATLLTEITG